MRLLSIDLRDELFVIDSAEIDLLLFTNYIESLDKVLSFLFPSHRRFLFLALVALGKYLNTTKQLMGWILCATFAFLCC